MARCPAAVKKAIVSALSQRDETADICTDDDGNPEAGPRTARHGERAARRRRERLLRKRSEAASSPMPGSTPAYGITRIGEVGKVGYEINFNRYFYQYQPPRDLELIEADIKGIETENPGDAEGGCGMTVELNGIDHSVRRGGSIQYTERLAILGSEKYQANGRRFV